MLIKLSVTTALLAVSLAACSTIQSKPYLSQPVGQSLRVGVGGVIVHVDRKRNLENAFGRADLFGRKTNEGFAELRFMGMHDGKVAIRRVDVAVYSDETTMSRSGIYVPNNSTATTTGMVGTTPFSATTNVSGLGTYIPPRPANFRRRGHRVCFERAPFVMPAGPIGRAPALRAKGARPQQALGCARDAPSSRTLPFFAYRAAGITRKPRHFDPRTRFVISRS